MAKKPYSPRISRREFTTVVMTFVGTIMGIFVGLPVIGYILTPALKKSEAATDEWVSVGPLDSYPIGTPKLFTFTRTKVNGWEKTVNSYGVFVVRSNENDLTVFSNVCTHLSCHVSWVEEENYYACPCHDGFFELDGSVISGPPPRAMDEYAHRIQDGNIEIDINSLRG